MNKKKSDNDNIDIDLLQYLIILRKNIKFIVSFLIISSLLGIFYSLSIKNEYTSYSTFYPHYENIESSSGIRGLAGLAGINLQDQNSKNIPTNLYPQLINSFNFKNDILKTEIIFNNKKINYREYLLTNNNNLSLEKILRLPLDAALYFFKILKNTINNDFVRINTNENLSYINEIDNSLFKTLDKKISIQIFKKEGFINLSVTDFNPEISAIVATKAKEILQNQIIEFKLKNLNDVFGFTSNQLIIAKNNLYGIEDSLANFKDSNKNIKSDVFLNQLNRLETEYSINKNIYNELALTKERIAIDVRKNTPIFTVINPVFVPFERSSPNRVQIVLLFLFLGIIMSFSWVLLKNQIFSSLKLLK